MRTDTGLLLGYFISLLFGVMVAFILPFVIGKVNREGTESDDALAFKWMRILGCCVIVVSVILLILYFTE